MAMRVLLILILSCSCLFGQTALYGPFTKFASGSSTWYPTNAANDLAIWAELTPINGTWGPTSSTHPAGDGISVKLWTNFASGGGVWTADQTLNPTNFVAGAGTNSAGPRILFTAASSTRLAGFAWPTGGTTNKATYVIVANCTATSGQDFIIVNGSGGTPFVSYNAKALSCSQGSTLTSATTMGTGYYVITVVFAAGASSHIDTNGVQMVSGTMGTGAIGGQGVYIANFNSPCYHGNICRVWGWNGVLSAGDLTSAVNQCRIDFGI